MSNIQAPILASYENGNTVVTLYADGSKTREYERDPAPLFPESIDLKITDYCDAGCQFCHEQSTRQGVHGQLADIKHAVFCLPPGVEIAIGGGNPLAHPDLSEILCFFRQKGLISNLTVNALHLHRFTNLILSLRARKLVYGLGISFHQHIMETEEIADDDTVIHFIAGVHSIQEALQCPFKMLILGYKQFGFGIRFYSPAVEESLARWRYFIPSLMKRRRVSFDNLALEQLKVRRHVIPEVWEECFMGADGRFTMYVDAVRREYAVSSTSPRLPLEFMTAREAFLQLQ